VWVTHRPQALLENLLCTGSAQAAASFKACPPPVARGPPRAAVCIRALVWSSMGCRGPTCFTTVFTTCCSAQVPGAPLPPPFLTLMSAGLFLSHFSHPVSQLLHSVFLAFLKYASTEAPLIWLKGSALSNVGFILEPALYIAEAGAGLYSYRPPQQDPSAHHCQHLAAKPNTVLFCAFPQQEIKPWFSHKM